MQDLIESIHSVVFTEASNVDVPTERWARISQDYLQQAAKAKPHSAEYHKAMESHHAAAAAHADRAFKGADIQKEHGDFHTAAMENHEHFAKYKGARY